MNCEEVEIGKGRHRRRSYNVLKPVDEVLNG